MLEQLTGICTIMISFTFRLRIVVSKLVAGPEERVTLRTVIPMKIGFMRRQRVLNPEISQLFQ